MIFISIKSIFYILLACIMGFEVIDMKGNMIDTIAMALVIVGGLNWGLVGLADFDLVKALLGSVPFLQNTVYTLVGVAAAYMVYYMTK
jgi:uncharacterized protein